MVEGLLLQVSLPEVQNLYNVLLDRVSSLHADRCTPPPQAEPTDCSPHMHFNSQGNNHQVQSASQVNHLTCASLLPMLLSLLFFKGWHCQHEGQLRKESKAASGEGGFRPRRKEGQKAHA